MTPEADSIAALAHFAVMRQAEDPRWHLLTGSRVMIERLVRESFFVGLGDPSAYGVRSLAHTKTLVLLDGQARIRGLYAGTLPLEAERLEQDIRTLLVE